MNEAPLPIANGTQLRLRVEWQSGSKMAKYVRTSALTNSFASLSSGKGSYWADRGDEWYGDMGIWGYGPPSPYLPAGAVLETLHGEREGCETPRLRRHSFRRARRAAPMVPSSR